MTRYHSLVVDEDTLPEELTVTTRTEAGAIMGLSHGHTSFTAYSSTWIHRLGGRLQDLANFLRICGREVPTGEDLAALESQVLRLDERFPGQMHP